MKIGSNSKKILTLKKIHSLIKVSKLKSLAEIAKFNKNFLNRFENALFYRDLMEYFEKKYNFENVFFNKNKEKNSKRKIAKETVLWFYLTEEYEINSFSYESLNKELLAKFDKKNDIFIPIGEDAIKFAKENQINSLIEFKDNKSENLVENLNTILYSIYVNGNAKAIKFVLNTNKTKDKIVTVLPIKELELEVSNYEHEKDEDISNYKFYPSILEVNKNIVYSYLTNILSALISESRFYTVKQKYAKQNDLLKNIEEKIDELKFVEISNKRKQLTDEIILASQNNK
ncbi:MSC_0622 family F1-like ATPase gamma subunit [[Mycoplasma] mobile]|uniref:Expressed protein n=1 Tax=Mycoplasma mobile (strain ATCC 43663 / 163K / NCTC 11711) TaxID=267748 RepID=Q6KHZ0_MYCM1|nr:hypothetical protein [[Mycoplasma] mobile]AAT27786.1 expressed protein [Mycoplasma mobile 163K]